MLGTKSTINIKFFIGLFFLSTLLISPDAWAQRNSSKLKLMSYNVENLFDTVKDEGKDDWAYQPLSFKRNNREHSAACAKITVYPWRMECLFLDWNDQVLNEKIKNIASVISTAFEGQGPDVIALQEVENLNVLQQLQQRGLRNKGYRYIALIDGPDTRGIDVAFLSRIPLHDVKDHYVQLPRDEEGNQSRPTRTILEATVKVNNKNLTLFSNHWPAQGNPTTHRVAAAHTLVEVARKASARGNAVVALGDFNSVYNEIIPSGPVGSVIKTDFLDGIEIRLDSTPDPTQMPGTHWYRGSWGFLDRVLVFERSVRNNNLQVDWNSIDVHAPEFALSINEHRRSDGTIERRQIPHRFNPKEKIGFSDHLPLVLEVSL